MFLNSGLANFSQWRFTGIFEQSFDLNHCCGLLIMTTWPLWRRERWWGLLAGPSQGEGIPGCPGCAGSLLTRTHCSRSAVHISTAARAHCRVEPSSRLGAVAMQPLGLLLIVLAGSAKAQYSSCPEPYGLQLYPHEQYCDKFYKCANGEFCNGSTVPQTLLHEYQNVSWWILDIHEYRYLYWYLYWKSSAIKGYSRMFSCQLT